MTAKRLGDCVSEIRERAYTSLDAEGQPRNATELPIVLYNSSPSPGEAEVGELKFHASLGNPIKWNTFLKRKINKNNPFDAWGSS